MTVVFVQNADLLLHQLSTKRTIDGLFVVMDRIELRFLGKKTFSTPCANIAVVLMIDRLFRLHRIPRFVGLASPLMESPVHC